MAGPYCKDCKFWYQMIRSEQGECRDRTKRIYAKYGDSVNSEPVTNPTDSCANWTAKQDDGRLTPELSHRRTESMNVIEQSQDVAAGCAPATGSVAAAKRIVIEVDTNSINVTMPNELTKRENDRLDFGLRQAIKELRERLKAKPTLNAELSAPPTKNL